MDNATPGDMSMIGDGIVRALRERPCMLHRFPRGKIRHIGLSEASPDTLR
jgi:hypothetical protein